MPGCRCDDGNEERGTDFPDADGIQDSAETDSHETDIDETDFDSLLKATDEKEDSIAHEVDNEEDIFSKADSVGAATPEPNTGSIFDTTDPSAPETRPEETPEKPLESNTEQPIFNGGDDDFDFSDDPELQELEAQYQEAKSQYESYQAELRQKDEQVTKLATTRDEKAQTAQEKKQEADRIIELKRIAARNERIAKIKAELSNYKNKSIDAAAQISEQDKRIDSLNNEINSYQTSIEQSERIIEEEKRTKK